MKADTLHKLMMARILLEDAEEICLAGDKFMASSGLVILQDAVELVLIACLIEKGVDPRGTESLSFPQLLKEIEKIEGLDIRVVRSTDLVAMNKQRVLVKHYGQMAEPATVANYLEASREAVGTLLREVVNVDLNQIVLSELLSDGEAKDFMQGAYRAMDNDKPLQALIETRKALFVEIEADYSVIDWKDYVSESGESFLEILLDRGGRKAPFHTKNKSWIEENVRTPFDYIQLDHNQVRDDLVEWGVPTQDFWNVRRLTPGVFRGSKDGKWSVRLQPKHVSEGATMANARYCVDRAVSLILKKHHHHNLARYIGEYPVGRVTAKVKDRQPVYNKASISSTVSRYIEVGVKVDVRSSLTGLDGKRYLEVWDINILHKPSDFLHGFVLARILHEF